MNDPHVKYAHLIHINWALVLAEVIVALVFLSPDVAMIVLIFCIPQLFLPFYVEAYFKLRRLLKKTFKKRR